MSLYFKDGQLTDNSYIVATNGELHSPISSLCLHPRR